MSDMSVADSTRVSIQARQNANDAKGREDAFRPPERPSPAPVESAAVHISTSSTGEKAAELANMLDEMVKTTDSSRRDNSPAAATEKSADTGSTEDLQASSETAASELAEQVSSGLAQDKLSMTTPADRNILQYLTG